MNFGVHLFPMKIPAAKKAELFSITAFVKTPPEDSSTFKPPPLPETSYEQSFTVNSFAMTFEFVSM